MKLLDVYECSFISDKGKIIRYVAASSFGKAAKLAWISFNTFEDKEAYELVKIVLSHPIFVE